MLRHWQKNGSYGRRYGRRKAYVTESLCDYKIVYNSERCFYSSPFLSLALDSRLQTTNCTGCTRLPAVHVP